jgi:AcrR family transcriptional regulator
MAQRLSRGERKEQTRADLVAAARAVFLRRGFHPASLDEIADQAGYTKGAVYSNFGGKDELFLAVLDARYDEQLRTHSSLVRGAGTFEAGLRAAAHQLAEQSETEPEWIPLLVEFWTHASRRPLLRDEVLKRHQQQLDGLAALLTDLADRHGLQFVRPAREAARGANALTRGIALERQLNLEYGAPEHFADMFATLILGFTQQRGASP